MKKRIVAVLAVIALTASMAACGSKEAENETVVDTESEMVAAGDVLGTEIEEETETETEEPEVLPDGMYRSELTNELISIDIQDQRPIAAMVDNELTALPHYGFSQADVVYEMMNSTENGRITRFMVLVKDWESIEQLGSIRSVRPTNVILSAEWNAVLCHDGGPFYIDEYLADPSTDNFSGTFSRVDNGKSREFTEYILSGDLDKNFANTGVSKTYTEYYPGAHYQFASESNPNTLEQYADAFDVALVDLPFPHNGSWLDYDEEDGLYYYSEYGEAHVDAGNNNEQTSFKNLLIQCCSYEVYDSNGYMIYDCEGMGDAYFITNGKAIPVTWQKWGMTDITRYYDADNNQIELNTGKTYVALVPDDVWDELVLE